MKKIIATMLFGISLLSADILQKESSLSYEETLKNIEASILAKKLTIFAKLDHQKAAKEAGIEMKPATVLVFGNPKVGSLLMKDNMQWSYELPLKIAVYENNNGKVIVRARELTDDIKTPNESKKLENINNLLKKLVNENK